MKKAVLLVLSFVLISSFAWAEDVTIEFIQWWAQNFRKVRSGDYG